MQCQCLNYGNQEHPKGHRNFKHDTGLWEITVPPWEYLIKFTHFLMHMWLSRQQQWFIPLIFWLHHPFSVSVSLFQPPSTHFLHPTAILSLCRPLFFSLHLLFFVHICKSSKFGQVMCSAQLTLCYDFKWLDNHQQSKDQKMSLEEWKLDLYCLARFENVK